jgi:hypothetical protein
MQADWKPVADQPPPTNKQLMVCGHGGVRLGYLDDRGNWRKRHHAHMAAKPTHWDFMPEAAK